MNRDAHLIDLAARQHHLVSDADALATMGREAWERAQARGIWVEVAPGSYRHRAFPETFEMTVRAGAAWLEHRGALHGASALRWLGLEEVTPRRVEFLVPRGRRSIRSLDLVTTTRWDDADITRHRGVRTTNATRAIIDYAASRPGAHVLANTIDTAVRLRLTSHLRLGERLEALSGPGRHGCALVRELLLDSGGESYLERRFLRLLREHGFPRPECQRVFKDDGTTIARVDFYFPLDQVVVEVSGRRGHSSALDRQRDARRRNHLQHAGATVLEFTTSDVIDSPGYVLSTLHQALSVTRPPRPLVVGV